MPWSVRLAGRRAPWADVAEESDEFESAAKTAAPRSAFLRRTGSRLLFDGRAPGFPSRTHRELQYAQNVEPLIERVVAGLGPARCPASVFRPPRERRHVALPGTLLCGAARAHGDAPCRRTGAAPHRLVAG